MHPLLTIDPALASILPHWFLHAFHHNYIDVAIDHVQRWMDSDASYWVMFGLLFSCGLGVPLPEDIPLLLGGFFVADGKMNLAITLFAGWCGIISGDCILYSLGHLFGMNITKVPLIGTHVSVKRINEAHGLFEKYGIWVVAVGRLFAGIRGAMVIAAGTLRYNFIKFIIADGLAACVSGGMFIALGFWGRRKLGDLHHIERQIEHYQRFALIGLLIVLLLFLLWNYRKTRKEERLRLKTEALAEPKPLDPLSSKPPG
jgi:membrane protein DedA with SNARE-associated domain